MNLIENADQQIRYILGNLLVENTLLEFENNKLKSELDAANARLKESTDS